MTSPVVPPGGPVTPKVVPSGGPVTPEVLLHEPTKPPQAKPPPPAIKESGPVPEKPGPVTPEVLLPEPTQPPQVGPVPKKLTPLGPAVSEDNIQVFLEAKYPYFIYTGTDTIYKAGIVVAQQAKSDHAFK